MNWNWCRAYGARFENWLTDKTNIVSYLKKQLEVRNEQVFDLLEKSLENSKDECRSETERLENENLFLCKEELLLQWSNDVLHG